MMELPLNKVLVGDNREIMANLPFDSIDLVVTSPPYWGLRDYGTSHDIEPGKMYVIKYRHIAYNLYPVLDEIIEVEG